MPLHFTQTEFDSRIARARDTLAKRDLDGLLLFAPESHYYLCGFDTFGFAMFQCLVLRAEGELHLLCRAPDLRQAQLTSTLADDQIHIWLDREGVSPTDNLCQLLCELGLHSKRLGIETKTVGLTAFNWQALSKSLNGKLELVEASDLVSLLRRDKSPVEIEYHRRSAALADDALDAALEATGPGAFEGDILAAMQGAVFKGGGDYAGNEFVIGSGPAALLCRYQSGRRTLETNDQMTPGVGGSLPSVSRGDDEDPRRRQGQWRAKTHARGGRRGAGSLRSGRASRGEPMGQVFDAHARVFDRHGFAGASMRACGYGMGAVYNPIWVDFPMFYQGNPLLMQAGNVFFLHMILMDSDTGLAMCLGHSVLVRKHGVERLSRHPLDLVEIDQERG